MRFEVDDSIRLTNAVLLRKGQAGESLRRVRTLVETSESAVGESRRLLAQNDALLKRLVVQFPEVPPEPMLSGRQLEHIAALIAKARGGHAFIWHASDPLPVFAPAGTTAIQ